MKGLAKLFVAGFATAALVILGYVYLSLMVPSGGTPENYVIEVPPGQPFYKIAYQMENDGAIRSARILVWYSTLTGKAAKVQVGEYEVGGEDSAISILGILMSGKSKSYPVTIQEGLNMYEIADILSQKGFVQKDEFLNLAKDEAFIQTLLGERQKSLEGYLFPDTYTFTKATTPKQIVSAMVGGFLKAYDEVIPSDIKVNRQNVVILASLIEKETGAAFERPQISSVFHNRLKKGMRLQTDPTIIYGLLMKTGVMTRNIRRSDIMEKNDYNTYTFSGLPAGPISNPGKESLRAAVVPDKTEYLYFVSRNDGTHYFSKTYEEHNRAVKEFQLNRKAREGKSWRDLKQKKNH